MLNPDVARSGDGPVWHWINLDELVTVKLDGDLHVGSRVPFVRDHDDFIVPEGCRLSITAPSLESGKDHSCSRARRFGNNLR
jgi:hypothetical protein